jgi:CBS domain containing-hemolysin-like protein
MRGPEVVHVPADRPVQEVFEAVWNTVTSRFPVLAGNR